MLLWVTYMLLGHIYANETDIITAGDKTMLQAKQNGRDHVILA